MSDDNNCCSGKTKQGRPCRAAATESGYCYFHTNPDVAAELGRIGGRSTVQRRVSVDKAAGNSYHPFAVIRNEGQRTSSAAVRASEKRQTRPPTIPFPRGCRQ